MSHHKRDMPSQGIDFGSTSPNFVVHGNVINDHIPGAWLGDSGSDSDCEDFLDADMTRSTAKAIADSTLADLQRAAAEAEDERLRRQTLRERERGAAEEKKVAAAAAADSKTLTFRSLASLQREISEEEERVRSQASHEHHAGEDRKLAPVTPKSSQKSTPPKKLMTAYPLQINLGSVSTDKPRRSHVHPPFNWGGLPSRSSTAVPEQSNASSGPTNKARRSYFGPSLDSTRSPSTSSTPVPAKSDASRVTSIKPRRSHIDPSPNSGEQKVGPAPAHEKGFLSLMDGFNARGGAHNSATRQLFDGGFFSEDQIAAAAARAKLRADVYASNGEVTPENRLAAARARLATEGRVVATVSQRPSESGSSAVKGVYSQVSALPKSSQASATLSDSKPLIRKLKIRVAAGTTQPGSSTADGVEQPVCNEMSIRQLLANKPQPEGESGRRSTSDSVFPIYNRGQAPKSSSTKLATTAAAAPKTTTTPSHSVSEKVQAIVRFYGDALNAFDDATAAKFVAHKLKEDTDFVDLDAGKTSSTKLAAATKTTGTTPSQLVSEKVQAILHSYGDAMNAFDNASAAGFVAYKLKEDADFDTGGKHSTKLTAATKTTGTTSDQSVSDKAQVIARRYASAVRASHKPAQNFAAQKLGDRISIAGVNAGNETSTPAQLKSPTSSQAQSTNGLTLKLDTTKAAEVDHDFDVLSSKGPSAANGSPLPDPDSIMGQLDMEFSPILKGFQGWEDDYDSDDSEEWDLGGLAEWKWIGEKSAQQSSAARGQV